MQQFSFTYWTAHDPEDTEGDEDTPEDDPEHFDPRYYATALLRAAQYEEPPEKEDEWRYLGLAIQPDGLYLREWDADEVTEIGGIELKIPHEAWHEVTISFGGEDGNTVTVRHLRDGEDEVDSFDAVTTVPGGGRVGFGVGKAADFRFDNVGTREDVTLTASTSLRYYYDANGRVVGRTLDPGEVTEQSQFFIYDGDRIIQELDESGNLVAAWDYGVYIDEILVMYRDVVPPAGPEPYYYLQDDHYNVIALADETGAVVERYAYDDYGAPSFYDGAGNAISGSQYGNPFQFQGRRWDEVLSLYDYRTRYYDPALGRFLRIDTIGLWGDANNLGNPYVFVGNNPWTRLDPYGEQPSGFLGFDAEGRAIQQPAIGETFEAIAEAHKVLVADPIRRVSPNPGPISAALQSELLIVDRSEDIDLIENGNNAAYTTTQVILIVSPTKIFKIIKGAKNTITGARGARTVTMSVNSAEEGAGALGKIAAAGDKVEVLDNVSDAGRSAEREIVRRFDTSKNIRNAKKAGIEFDPKKGNGIPTTTTNIEPVNPDAIREATGARAAESFADIDITGKDVLRKTTKAGKTEIVVRESINAEDIVQSGRVRRSWLSPED